MSQDSEAETATVQPKYTRYRSVRRAAAEESAAKELAALEATSRQQKGDGPVRSMSRYRRPRAASKVEQNVTPVPTTTVPAIPAIPALPVSQMNQAAPARVAEPAPVNQAQTAQKREGSKPVAQTVEEKLAEQKRKDLERLEATLDAAIQGPAVPRIGSPAKDKFGFFSRKKSVKSPPPAASTPPLPAPAAPVPAPSRPRSTSIVRSSGSNETPRTSKEPPLPLGPGGTVILPGTDAPISAVNAGERRVLVRHKQSSINLPITPHTTALDIFYSSANIMSHNIAPANTILLESYTQLGLERRVRRYEHIRDIMNSWDRDTQNALILQNSDSPKFDTDLEAASVPKDPPPDVTVYLYHSQKPGRWHKCYVTLLATGQMFMSKKAGAKSSDKDVVNLCHLSDFDIYTPVPAQLRKLRAPKKHCYAVKSQQKTTMFLSTENFVHFFSSDDEILANKWYGAVQRWRSWYLVHRMGEGGDGIIRAKTGKKTTTPMTAHSGKAQASGQTSSGDDKPYMIGSFQPLYSGTAEPSSSSAPAPATAQAPAPEVVDTYDSDEDSRPLQVPFHLRNSTRLSSTGAPPARDSRRHPPPVSYRLPADAEEEFASSSLLGRTYSERLKAQREREIQSQANCAPFTDGPVLLNNTGSGPGAGTQHRRSLSVRSSKTGAGAREREPPQPLLDFTPKFKEAPQWDRVGKGKGVTAPEGVPLVQVATGRGGTAGAGVGVEQMMFRREDSVSRRPGTARYGNATGGGSGGASIMNRGRASYD